MNTPMTPPDSPADRTIGALLRDAHALVATATDQALRDAGSSPREFRLLERLSRMNETDNGGHSRHRNARIDRKVAHPGSLAATFAARGWLAYSDQSWRLTAAGVAEHVRLTDVAARAIPAAPDVREALTALIDALGGPDAARSARRAQRHVMRERFASRHAGHGKRHMHHGFGHPGERRDHHGDRFGDGRGHAFHPEHPRAHAHGHGHGCEHTPHGEHSHRTHPHGIHARGRGFTHAPEHHHGGAPGHQR